MLIRSNSSVTVVNSAVISYLWDASSWYAAIVLSLPPLHDTTTRSFTGRFRGGRSLSV
jgi:hypothetical protein